MNLFRWNSQTIQTNNQSCELIPDFWFQWLVPVKSRHRHYLGRPLHLDVKAKADIVPRDLSCREICVNIRVQLQKGSQWLRWIGGKNQDSYGLSRETRRFLPFSSRHHNKDNSFLCDPRSHHILVPCCSRCSTSYNKTRRLVRTSFA